MPTPALGPIVSLPGQALLHAGDEEATGLSLTGLLMTEQHLTLHLGLLEGVDHGIPFLQTLLGVSVSHRIADRKTGTFASSCKNLSAQKH